MKHPLEGINEKLKRSEQNIGNFNLEIEKFLDDGKYRVIRDDNEELIKEFIEYVLSREVPIRFSILAGEIVHHLRSCLDHLIWQLIIINGGNPDAIKSEFPIFIFDRKPANKEETARFRRKIKGVSTKTEAAIERLQPYNRGAKRLDDPLFVIHEMDRADKHRELVIIIPDPKRSATWALFGLPGPAITLVSRKDATKEIAVSTSRGREVKVDGQLTAQFEKPDARAFHRMGDRRACRAGCDPGHHQYPDQLPRRMVNQGAARLGLCAWLSRPSESRVA